MRFQRGFTLIELMIVVGILGILMAIAAPKWNIYQRRSLQSEAKVSLASIHSLQKQFFSQYYAYAPAFDAMGYIPATDKRYYALIANPSPPYGGTISGFRGSAVIGNYAVLNSPYAYHYSLSPIHNCVFVAYGNNPQTFVAGAAGITHHNAAYTDVWTVDQNKNLRNCSNGL